MMTRNLNTILDFFFVNFFFKSDNQEKIWPKSNIKSWYSKNRVFNVLYSYPMWFFFSNREKTVQYRENEKVRGKTYCRISSE